MIGHCGDFLKLLREVYNDVAILVYIKRCFLNHPRTKLINKLCPAFRVLKLILRYWARQQRWKYLAGKGLNHAQDEFDVIVNDQRLAHDGIQCF